ncbi:WD40-repeat-containing domain protein [Hypomontagnella monticulosa]|nr:WD40-repeat-containing domain protein [Hypomontagnella monticulosa]
MVAAAGADKQCHVLHAATGQQAAIGAHDSPVRSVRFVEVPGANGVPIIASGSWDKTVRFWDLRQRDALAAVACNNRVFSMDSKARLLVVATAERHIHLFDLQNPTSIAKTLESPLRNQTKSVAAFPDGKGWATASIEGRCGINAVDEAEASSVNFTFRCHRDPPDLQQDTKVWSVNDVRFHPARDSVFTTAGSDGTFHFWDRIAHSRLRGYPAVGAPITATAFNHDGSCFAYAIGYDWSRGCVGNSPSIQTQLVLHPVTAEDTSPRRK